MSRSRKPLVMLLAAPDASVPLLYGLSDVLPLVGSVPTEMALGDVAQEILAAKGTSADDRSMQCVGNIPHGGLRGLDATEMARDSSFSTTINAGIVQARF